MAKAKKIFIAATRQDDGKTTVSLGLFQAMQRRYKSLAYMKPVGQQYVLVDDEKIDKDAYLFYKSFGLDNFHLKDMSPIAVPRGFTRDYINKPNKKQLETKITEAYARLSNKQEFILFEGTGHAGVGSVFDLSNARVAELLKTKVIIVSIGGIGKSIDELMLNITLFKNLGVEIAGVIINKVYPKKLDEIKTVVSKGLSRFKVPLLGTIPLMKQLTYPSVAAIIEELKPKVLSGKKGLNNCVEKFIIGDMSPHFALDRFSKNTLMIVPGNREGLILTGLCENMLRTTGPRMVSGIIFTNGIKPHPKILELLSKTRIPLLLVKEDAFTVATEINTMIFKIRSEDLHKITLAADIIEEHVDVDTICNSI
ncbi:hypothetical protein DID77_03395 [Candidatus Marinamargulisbacteria bacterium SCGC AG-439-L15]|nr:hypothetical protein DID77_03395 [Candidatus Marinamargulisbacteria bacterium SCGC AG-439-L15]